MSVARSAESPKPVWDHCLPFERTLAEIHTRLVGAPTGRPRQEIQDEFNAELERVFKALTPWERVQLARHPLRPRMLDYVRLILDDLFELHGDRLGGDDPAIVGGIGRFQDRTIVVVGQEKGRTTEEKVSRNFGMAHPEGYRKALRLFQMAERLKLPVVTFVDTPAAHPGIEAEERGQGSAIAVNLLAMSGLKTPIFSVVIGEGGSGGALGIAVGDFIAMLEHSIYVICPPERCAEILWRDVDKKEIAASAMRVTAHDLKELGVIDSIIEEPHGGAHRDPAAAAKNVSAELARFLDRCDRGDWSPEARQARFQHMGAWSEAGV